LNSVLKAHALCFIYLLHSETNKNSPESRAVKAVGKGAVNEKLLLFLKPPMPGIRF